jgi:RNA recognition motif-containing protein
MSKKLFVGGLAWGTTDEGLHGAFSRFGEIAEATVIMDRETGRSRGFGFVTFANDEHAVAAVSEMNGAELDGRTIKVNEAEDKGFRAGGGGGRGPGGPRGGGYKGGGSRDGGGGGRGGYDRG